MMVGSDYGTQIIICKDNGLTLQGDYDHPDQATPTMFWQSVQDPDNSNSEYFSATHSGDDAVFTAGYGGFSWATDAQPARGTMAVTGDVSLDETFVLNATTFTAKAAELIGDDQFLRAGTVTQIAASIVAVINGGSESANAHAYNTAGVVTIEWLTKGTAGNAITFTEALTNVTITGTGTLGGTHAGVAAATLATLTEDGVFTSVVPRGEMTMYEATQTITINTASVYHAVLGYSTGDVQNWTFDAGRVVDANIDSVSNPSASVLRVKTSAAHNLTTGDVVTQTGLTSNAAHNGITMVTVVDADEYDCDDIAYVAGAGADNGAVDEPSYLQAGAGAAGDYAMSFSVSMQHSAGAANTFKWEINLNETEPDVCVGESVLANNEITTVSGSCFDTIAVGDRVWLAIKNKTGANDVVLQHSNVNLRRM